MNTYIITVTYYQGGASTTISFNVKAMNKNDAFIVGAGKAYGMFAGTEVEILGIGITVPI